MFQTIYNFTRKAYLSHLGYVPDITQALFQICTPDFTKWDTGVVHPCNELHQVATTLHFYQVLLQDKFYPDFDPLRHKYSALKITNCSSLSTLSPKGSC